VLRRNTRGESRGSISLYYVLTLFIPVMPAKAGIQGSIEMPPSVPAFAGTTEYKLLPEDRRRQRPAAHAGSQGSVPMSAGTETSMSWKSSEVAIS